MRPISSPREYVCGDSLSLVASYVYPRGWRRTSESTWERPGQDGGPPVHVVYVSDPRRLIGVLGGMLHMAPFVGSRSRARQDFLDMAGCRRMRVSHLFDMERAIHEAQRRSSP
jgi:hypothetical protein